MAYTLKDGRCLLRKKNILCKVLKTVPATLEMPDLSEQWNWVFTKDIKDTALHTQMLSPNSHFIFPARGPSFQNPGQYCTGLSQI